MVQLLSGFQVSQALYVAAKLGVADRLADGPVPVAQLSDDLDTDPLALARLLRTLASLGVFNEAEPGVYDLTPLGATLVSDREGSMRDLALNGATRWERSRRDPPALQHTKRRRARQPRPRLRTRHADRRPAPHVEDDRPHHARHAQRPRANRPRNANPVRRCRTYLQRRRSNPDPNLDRRSPNPLTRQTTDNKQLGPRE